MLPGMKTRRIFVEQASMTGASRVDRAAGVIFGVRVLGRKSDNGREYLPEAIARALPLYEGASVRVNHPKRPDDQRDTEDVLGWLVNVRQSPDGGAVADLHLLTEHSLAARVMEAAERNPRLFGLSHNAQGDGEVCGTAIESPMTVTAKIELVKGASLKFPRAFIPGGAARPEFLW